MRAALIVLLAAALAASAPAVESGFTATARTGRSHFAAAAAFPARPAIQGEPVVGATLTATPAAEAYRWLRCAPDCQVIPGEDQARLLVTGDDAGATLRVETEPGGTSAATAPVARATYTHILCADPQTGLPAGAGDVLPDGLTFATTDGALPDPAPAVRCDTHAPVVALAGPSPRTPVRGDAGRLEYAARPATTVLTGELYRQGRAGGGWAWSIDDAERCAPAEGCTQRGSANDRFSAANRLTTSGPFRVVLACEAATCERDAGQIVRLFGARIALRDDATPRLTGPASGSLVTDAYLSGIEAITLSATDAGAGLYRVRASIDGTPLATRTLCTDRGPYTFATRRPCPAALSAHTVAFDTTAWPRTGRLRVHLEDAGRNTTTVLNRRLG